MGNQLKNTFWNFSLGRDFSLRNWFLFYALGLAAVPSLELLEVRMLPFLRTYVMIPLVPPSPIEHFLNFALYRAKFTYNLLEKQSL